MDQILEEKVYALALYEAEGLGSTGLRKLLEEFASPAEILEQKEEVVERILQRKLKTDIFSRHKKNRDGFFRECLLNYKKTESEGIHFCFCGEEEYPKRLLKISDYPFGLYYMGSLPKENLPCVSIIGARECSEYGRKCAEIFGKMLANYGIQIVSGMARGVDGISQEAAISAGGTSFGILGSGVDVCYPKENRGLYEKLIENGGIISEFAPGTEAKSNFFPMRNRIISGFADILLVVEARKKSGTYITVCQALEQGKEIFAVPGRITDGLSDGCNRLIEEGAGMACDPGVILEALGCIGGDVNSLINMPVIGRSSSYDGAKHVEKSAILKVLEDTPKRMEVILSEVKHYGVDLSYTDLLCLMTELCIEGRADGGGDYYRAV